jgi:hypothetical protein
MMNKIESVQKLGIVIGRTIGSIYEARRGGLQIEERNNSSKLRCLLDIASLEVETDQRETLYKGLAEGLVRSRAPLVKVYAALVPLPGEPKFEPAWTYTDDEFRSSKIFIDKREQSNIKATTDAAQLIIKFVVEQIHQIVKERDQRNGLR